ncbi:MAG TPA: hypothetical protein VF533_14525 [Solirubrobacteraceae bacterium]
MLRDEVVAQAVRLDDPHALGEHRPGGRLVGGVEPAGAQAGKLRLGLGDHRIAPSDLGPPARVDVEGEEAADLRRGRVQVPVAADDDPRRRVCLDDFRLRAPPVAFNQERAAQHAAVAARRQPRRSEPLPERDARRERPRAGHFDGQLV